MSHPIKATIETFRKYQESVSSKSDKDLLLRQINALYEIKKLLPKYGSIRYRISSFEKLISDPWMNDQNAFEVTYAAWNEFKESYKKEIGGMTVNERLCHLGLMDDFDASLGSPAKMKSILQEVFLSEENIEAIIKSPTRG